MSHTIRSRDETRVIGALAMLATSIVMGGVLAYVARGFYGVLYIPLITPCVLGAALGIVLARVSKRYQGSDVRSAFVAAVFGSVVLYVGYHLFVYERVLDFLVTQMTTFADAAASTPEVEVLRFLESETQERGFFAYLTFVSLEGNGALHPMGMLGALRPGLTGTLVAMLVEWAALLGVAAWVTRHRGAAESVAPLGERVREVIAHTDAGTLRAAMEAMDRGDYEAAGRVLRRPDVEEVFAVALVYNPYSAESYGFEIHEGAHLCTSRELSSWDGQALWDALRVK